MNKVCFFIRVAVLFFLLQALKCPNRQPPEVYYSVKVSLPTCSNPYIFGGKATCSDVYHLLPGQKFKISVNEKVDISTLNVSLYLSDQDTYRNDNITDSFEPKPIQIGKDLFAYPPSFAFKKGIHGGVWQFIAQAGFNDIPPAGVDTVSRSQCPIEPFSVQVSPGPSISLYKGETIKLGLLFSEKAVDDMTYHISIFKRDDNDPQVIVIPNASHPYDADFILENGKNSGEIYLYGKEEGSATVNLRFPGGVLENIDITVRKK